jgi:hypothetical protein
MVNRLAVTGAGAGVAGIVVLRDVASEPAATTMLPGGNGLSVSAIAVHAYRCSLRGGWITGLGQDLGNAGATVAAAGILVVDASSLWGGSPPGSTSFGTIGGSGLILADSRCVSTRTTIRGGSAAAGTGSSAQGGNGLFVQGTAQVHVYGAAVDSIAGGDAAPGIYSQGGVGIACASPAVVSVHGPVVLTGGSGSSAGSPVSGATVVTGLAQRLRLSIRGTSMPDGSLLATQPVALAIDTGTPAQLFVLLLDTAPGFTPIPGVSPEALLVSPVCVVALFGLLDGGGHFGTTFVPATQSPALVNVPLHWQAFEWSPLQGLWLGSNAEHCEFRL